MTVAGRRSKPVEADNESVNVKLTKREWRAVAAIITTAASIAEDAAHYTLMTRLSDQICQQIGFTLNPVPLTDENPSGASSGPRRSTPA